MYFEKLTQHDRENISGASLDSVGNFFTLINVGTNIGIANIRGLFILQIKQNYSEIDKFIYKCIHLKIHIK